MSVGISGRCRMDEDEQQLHKTKGNVYAQPVRLSQAKRVASKTDGFFSPPLRLPPWQSTNCSSEMTGNAWPCLLRFTRRAPK